MWGNYESLATESRLLCDPLAMSVASCRKTVAVQWDRGFRLINSMVTEVIRPVNYNPGCSQKLIKLEISSCRCSQLECNEENDETRGYSALYTSFLPLIEQTFNREGSLYLACNYKIPFSTSEQPKRYKLWSFSENVWYSPLSFGQYIYKIWLEII